MDYVIEPADPNKKGRSFKASCLAVVTANSLWDGGGGSDNTRPVWAMFGGSEAELKPFMTNLRLGRKANADTSYRRSNDRIEFLKSAGCYITWQRESAGAIATIYHPDLFRLDPGMVDPASISFAMLVPETWSQAQAVNVESAIKHVHKIDPSFDSPEPLDSLVATACLFAAYIDRRTRCPLIADERFYMQLLCASLREGMASFPGDNLKYGRSEGYTGRWGFQASGLSDVGIRHGVCFHSTHKIFEEFLANEVSKYFSAVRVVSRKPVKEAVQIDLFESA